MANVAEANKHGDLYLFDGKNVYFIPQGWAFSWSFAAGHTGGLDWTPDNDDMADGPEIYCYAPTGIDANSEVETLFVPVADLEKMKEIPEEVARRVHPALFETLTAINNE